MTRSSRRLRWVLVALATLLFAVSAMVGLWQALGQRTTARELTQGGLWLVTQAEVEVLRLAEAAASVQNGGPATPMDVARGIAVLRDRLQDLLTGDEAPLLERAGVVTALRETLAGLPEIERTALSLPLEGERYLSLRSALMGLGRSFDGLALRLLEPRSAEYLRDRELKLLGVIVACFALMTASGGVLVGMLLRQLRLRALLVERSRRAEESAQEASAMKTKFLAAAGHDLRQPLNALSLLLSLLEGRVRDPVAADLVEKSQQSAARIAEQLDAYLDVSRMDSGEVVAERCPVPLDRLLRSVVDVLSREAAAKGLHLRLVDSSAVAISDPRLLERLVFNLVSNAVRQTERGTVLVGCRRQGDAVRIDVTDTGPGIAPEHRELIFEEFFQVGNPERAGAKGLGLGLAIVRRLATLMGHSVEMETEVGRGSRFSVLVPRDALAVRLRRSSRKALANLRVAVIEDDPLIAAAMAATLAELGCAVTSAASAEEALEGVEGGPSPDLILADYRLPGQSGLAAVSALRRKFGAEIPACIVTGEAAPGVRTEALALGVGYLTKPVTAEALRRLVAEARRAPVEARASANAA